MWILNELVMNVTFRVLTSNLVSSSGCFICLDEDVLMQRVPELCQGSQVAVLDREAAF